MQPDIAKLAYEWWLSAPRGKRDRELLRDYLEHFCQVYRVDLTVGMIQRAYHMADAAWEVEP
jgi:hypothetical protein